MAILSSSNLSLEIIFKTVDNYGFVCYEIIVRCNDKLAINPKIYSHYKDYYSQAENVGIIASVDKNVGDTFIPFIENALKSKKPSTWSDEDYGVIITIIPEYPFSVTINKFNKTYSCPIEIYPKEINYTQIICLIDSSSLIEGVGYPTGDGLALHLSVPNYEIANFINQLKEEYAFMQNGLKHSSDGVYYKSKSSVNS